VLDAANAVIAHNTQRQPKALWTERAGGELITCYPAEDEHDEARWLVAELDRLHRPEGQGGCRYEWGDLAVFYRANAQSRAIEEELVRRDVPYQVVGGTRFYERKEIKDLLAYLRVLANPADEVSFKRILNVPKRGVGDTSADRLEAWARRVGSSFAEAVSRAEEAGVAGRALTGLRQLDHLLHELREGLDAGPAELLERVVERTGYLEELKAEGSLEAAGRMENIEELIGAARQSPSLEQFLEEVSLVADADEVDGDASRVTLMTLHTAKGLEFPVVFIVGMEEGVFPHVRSLGEPDAMEEERRLAYVGLTRARERLYLSHAWCRSLWGQTQFNPPSPFLSEIPDALVRRPAGARRPGSRRDDLSTRDRLVESALRSARTAPVHGSGADRLGLRVGETVVHAKWGEGVVIDVKGEGDRAEARVRFPAVGEKHLALALAPLKRA
jgi:DNA helicase-2/ATP-dependent DNA helicase PcrA